MAHPQGEAKRGPPRVDFDQRLKLEVHGREISSDVVLLSYRELDDAPGVSALAGEVLSDVRRGKNARHLVKGLLRQPVLGRLAGYEDVNDGERLSCDPAIVDRRWPGGASASSARMATLMPRADVQLGNVGYHHVLDGHGKNHFGSMLKEFPKS